MIQFSKVPQVPRYLSFQTSAQLPYLLLYKYMALVLVLNKILYKYVSFLRGCFQECTKHTSLPNSCRVPTIATLAIVRLTLPVFLPFWPPGGGAQSPAQGLLPVPGSVLEHGSYPSVARSSYDSQSKIHQNENFHTVESRKFGINTIKAEDVGRQNNLTRP